MALKRASLGDYTAHDEQLQHQSDSFPVSQLASRYRIAEDDGLATVSTISLPAGLVDGYDVVDCSREGESLKG